MWALLAQRLQIGLFFLPQSPRWLVQRGRTAEAEQVLIDIRKVPAEQVAEELANITESFDGIPPSSRIWQGLREQPALRRSLFLGCALQAAQQLAGINTVLYYSAAIFKSAGVTSDVDAIWLSAGVAGANFVFTLLGIWMVEYWGRRKLLLGSLAGVILVLVALGVAFHVSDAQSAPLGFNSGSCAYSSCNDCVNTE